MHPDLGSLATERILSCPHVHYALLALASSLIDQAPSYLGALCTCCSFHPAHVGMSYLSLSASVTLLPGGFTAYELLGPSVTYPPSTTVPALK